MDFTLMIFYVLFFIVIMYFLLIRPQKKREKKAAEMLSALKTGDKIVTIGGINGTIVVIRENDVVVESGIDKTKLEFRKDAIREVIHAELESDN